MLKATSNSLTNLNPETLKATGTISDPNIPKRISIIVMANQRKLTHTDRVESSDNFLIHGETQTWFITRLQSADFSSVVKRDVSSLVWEDVIFANGKDERNNLC